MRFKNRDNRTLPYLRERSALAKSILTRADVKVSVSFTYDFNVSVQGDIFHLLTYLDDSASDTSDGPQLMA